MGPHAKAKSNAETQHFVVTSAPLHSRGARWAVFECKLTHRIVQTRISGEWPCEPKCIVVGTAFSARLTESSYGGKREFKFAKGDVHCNNPELFATCQVLLNNLGTSYRTAVKLLVQKFGDSLPDRLAIRTPPPTCTGVSAKRVLEIVECFHENDVKSQVDVLRSFPAVPAAWVNLVLEHLSEFRENPYVICERVDAADRLKSLQVADHVSRQCGLAPGPSRARAYMRQAMHTLHSSTGSFYFLRADIISKARDMACDIDVDAVAAACDEALRRPALDETLETLPEFDAAESRLAEAIEDITRAELFRPPLRFCGGNDQCGLDHEQAAAVSNAVDSPISVLCGKAGTGKTHVIQRLHATLSNMGLSVIMCAPTGKAAQRIEESVGHAAHTVHRIIKSFDKIASPLGDLAVVVDEASMLSVSLCASLLSTLISSSHDIRRLVFVGDPNQLPSIDPGSVLRDLCNSNLPVTRLVRVHRQGEGSAIVLNAHRLLSHEPLQPSPGVFEVHVDDDPLSASLRMAETMLPSRVQFIVQTNVKRRAANVRLQELYNGGSTKGRCKYRLGDPVIGLVNIYNEETLMLSNGNIGVVASLDQKDASSVWELTVDFSQGTRLTFTEESDQIDLAYATTLHKFQGSEAPSVFFVMDNIPRFQSIQVAYTAFTRARERIFVFGSTASIREASRNDEVVNRRTLLSERLNVVQRSRFFA